jgi:hypothetical protein
MSYWMSQKERLAVTVACPFCGQPVGKSCEVRRGKNYGLYTNPHPARLRAAQRREVAG